MVELVGFRFLPTDEEIVDYYLRFKNLGGFNASQVDQVIRTVNFCNFDPWDLPREAMMASDDQVWYFFRRKQNRSKQIRKSKSGSWKKTGNPLEINRTRGHPEKIGKKSFLVFQSTEPTAKWVMHEYEATSETMPYTVCKVFIKPTAEKVSTPRTEVVAQSHSLPTHMNNELITGSEELQRSGFLDKQQQPELEASHEEASGSQSSFDCNSFLNDYEQIITVSTQNSQTGVFGFS